MSKNSTRFYKHYKNKPYKYLGVARHSETLEEMALYETLYENDLGRLWVRPKEMFFENVEINGLEKARFEKIEFMVQTEMDLPAARELYKKCFSAEFPDEKFNSKLQNHKHLLFLTAFDGVNAVGFKIGWGQDENIFYSWLGCVVPEYRGLGVASLLMQHQHDWCRKQGFKKVQTKTRNKFGTMLGLNLKSGFRITAVNYDKENEGDEIIVMEKNLGE